MFSTRSRTAGLSLLLLAACSGGGPAASTTALPATPTIATSSSSASPSPSASAPSSPFPSGPVSQREEAPLPEPRQEAATAVARGALWVLGGFDPNRRSSDSVFALGAGTWLQGPRLAQRVDHASAADLDGTLYYSGGFSDGPALTALYAYRPPTGWTRLAPMRHARGGHALLALGGKLYAIGGNGPGGNEPAVEQYDPAADAWVDFAVLPDPRNHVAGFVYRGLLCVAGGRTPAVARVDCLDPAGRSWSRLPDLPSPTLGAGAGTLGDRVIVVGGEDAAEANLVPQVFAFDGQAWATTAMLVPRHGIELAPFGGRLWACGGATSAGYAASATCTSAA